jgi:alpha-amylase
MVAICFYFQVHQPFRIKPYRVFEIGKDENYFDDEKNKEIMLKVANKCYLPMNKLLLDLIKKYNGKFKISFSISGVAIEQMEKYAPEVLNSFIELSKTGCVEFLSETYYHSLSFIYSKEEFKRQVELHRNLIKKYFNQEPKIFRNTELVYTNELANYIEDLGYKGILSEGWDTVLGWRSPNFVYEPSTTKGHIALLTKNYKLSDDIAFRFSNKAWESWPLTTEKYTSWVNQINGNGEILNLFMDYETFGEHQWADTGIFDFMWHLPEKILENPDNSFLTPSEVIYKFPKRDKIDVPFLLSWADTERDLSAWLGNKMQQEAISEIFQLEKEVKSLKDKNLLDSWRKLTTSDHFYYMCTKFWADGDVHKYFSAYDSPYDAYVYFMNVLNDLIIRIKLKKEKLKIQKEINKNPKNFKNILKDIKVSISNS